MRAKDLMTVNPACVTPDDSAWRAAQLMSANDCGCLPVVTAEDDGRIVGVVTDRDIVMRGVRQGRGPDARVRELMTAAPYCCSTHADIQEIERTMADRQVRRVMIVDDDHCCVGVISQADLALAAERGSEVSEREVARVVERISEPAPSSHGGSASAADGEALL